MLQPVAPSGNVAGLKKQEQEEYYAFCAMTK